MVHVDDGKIIALTSNIGRFIQRREFHKCQVCFGFVFSQIGVAERSSDTATTSKTITTKSPGQ